jgi:hypothetical protein
MTAIVGILCSDGVIIGTDSSVTLTSGQTRTIEQTAEKLTIVGDSVIIAGTGQVGLGQRFTDVVQKAWDAKVFSNPTPALHKAKIVCKNGLDDFISTSVQKGTYGALVAFVAENKAQLCEFAVSDLQPELKTNQLWYCSMGSTQHITDSFLALIRDILWKNGPPPLTDGIFAATWTLDHAVTVNPGGVNAPVRIARLSRGRDGQFHAEILDDLELQEHRQNIAGAKQYLLKYCEALHAADAGTAKVPRPTLASQ